MDHKLWLLDFTSTNWFGQNGLFRPKIRVHKVSAIFVTDSMSPFLIHFKTEYKNSFIENLNPIGVHHYSNYLEAILYTFDNLNKHCKNH